MSLSCMRECYIPFYLARLHAARGHVFGVCVSVSVCLPYKFISQAKSIQAWHGGCTSTCNVMMYVSISVRWVSLPLHRFISSSSTRCPLETVYAKEITRVNIYPM